MKCFVYRNLHKPGYYSIKALSGPLRGKVVGHAMRLRMKDCTFKVSEKGRQRVLSSGHKNVHAGIVGDLMGVSYYKPRYECDVPVWIPEPNPTMFLTRVTYNPTITGTFTKHTEPVYQEDLVSINEAGVWIR